LFVAVGRPRVCAWLDPVTLAYPEFRGNGVMASVGNVLENPHIGTMFLDFFHNTIGLHVNGTARVLSNEEAQVHRSAAPDMLAAIQIKGGRHPVCWVFVDVREAYIHCSKHIPLLRNAEKHIEWGTDDDALKGGDYFHARTSPRMRDDPAVKS
jgi:predicted pyridoxine 5'-phosphate oxidase superfamily flavin-nucleotide-binding protein